MMREAARVFLSARLLAGAAAQLDLDSEQFFEQRGLARLVNLVQIVLDARPRALLPGALEALGGGVDPGPV